MIGTFDALWAVVLDDLEAGEIDRQHRHHDLRPAADLPRRLRRAPGATRSGPFRLGPLGLVFGAGFMFLYGFMPTGLAMLGVGAVHAICDGLTASSAAVAVGVVAPSERQAGAQGILGAAETLTGGITAVLAGVLYAQGGRVLAYTTCTIIMVTLAVTAFVLAGPEYPRAPTDRRATRGRSGARRHRSRLR